ncbi:MAG TPA: DUF4349 domain-containing protein [Chloroflexota bacterium]|nr:DUF4349 domain-containing protein [Chloroflexota bacterium]
MWPVALLTATVLLLGAWAALAGGGAVQLRGFPALAGRTALPLLPADGSTQSAPAADVAAREAAKGATAGDQSLAGILPGAPAAGAAADAQRGAAQGQQGGQAGAVAERGAAQPLPPLPPSERMIVKSGALTLQVTDLAEGVRRIGDLVNGIPGAYVASTSTSYREREGVAPVPGQPAGQTASLTLKVPAADFGPAMERLRALGTPIQEQVSTQEVTEEFVDLEAQVRSLEAVEAQYLRLLERAQRIEEILPLQQRVTEVRTQIDRLRGRMNLLQRRADLSTISVNLVLPGRAGDPFAGPELRPLRTLRLAFTGLGTALQGLLDATIYLAVYLLPLLPVVGVVYWWRRTRRPAPQPTAGG